MSEAGKKSKYLCPMRCNTFAQWDTIPLLNDKYITFKILTKILQFY